jgi:hypothetical protein
MRVLLRVELRGSVISSRSRRSQSWRCRHGRPFFPSM